MLRIPIRRPPNFRPWLYRRPTLVAIPSRKRIVALGLTVAGVCATTFVLTSTPIHLDAPPASSEPSTLKDPATDIEFPTSLRIPSRFPLPTYTLLGVGVRKVSFLNIKVYSVGFYADLSSVPPISRSASFDEKIRHVVEHASCLIRIIPTRSTSYGHLRDGFMRALQARMIQQKRQGLLTAEEESRAASPLLKFKSIFPNTTFAKHTSLDLLLTPPDNPTKGSPVEERRLIVRDLGSVSNDWVSKEFVLAYFEGQGISPPLKQAVEDQMRHFGN